MEKWKTMEDWRIKQTIYKRSPPSIQDTNSEAQVNTKQKNTSSAHIDIYIITSPQHFNITSQLQRPLQVLHESLGVIKQLQRLDDLQNSRSLILRNAIPYLVTLQRLYKCLPRSSPRDVSSSRRTRVRPVHWTSKTPSTTWPSADPRRSPPLSCTQRRRQSSTCSSELTPRRGWRAAGPLCS